jgi:hypothetical protein
MLESIKQKITNEKKSDLLNNHLTSFEHYLHLSSIPVSNQKSLLVLYHRIINKETIEDIYFYPIDQIVNTMLNYIKH